MIVVLDIKEGIETQIPMPIVIKTQPSTRLDYDELIQERKLGEGSFGIVYLGDFRGNKVAIKKLKNSINTTDKNNKEAIEFEKEIR